MARLESSSWQSLTVMIVVLVQSLIGRVSCRQPSQRSTPMTSPLVALVVLAAMAAWAVSEVRTIFIINNSKM